MTQNTHRITEQDLRRHFDALDTKVSKAFFDYLAQSDTGYRALTVPELEEYVLMVLNKATHTGAYRQPEENRAAFEVGWRANKDALSAEGLTPDALRPRYFRGSKFLRYQKSIVITQNPQLEYDLLVLARHLIFSKHLAPFANIHELGCGSCGNLLQLSQRFPDKSLHGYDWAQASVQIAQTMGQTHGLKCSGHLLDMFNPSPDITLAPNSAVLTVHAMEQLGTDHGALIDWLLAKKPALVVQLEPIVEFYDPQNLSDKLALFYSQQRRYLTGYLTALRALHDSGKIQILSAHRPQVGGVIHEASLLVWRPLESLNS